ncbi:MAG: hypothetical protein PHQ43_03760 [Dehalococcoidales bacterium]|nr:hypothetical protein [Dehalococcoidales bacterium]
MDFELSFTRQVLGVKAAQRLEQHEVTQTIRANGSDIVQAVISGKLSAGDRLQILLDEKPVGCAGLVAVHAVTWAQMDQGDAERGGFDNLDELAHALQRAGYRYQPLEKYLFYRCQFRWLEGAKDDA